MEAATYIGISIADFWEITPHELHICIRSHIRRKRAESEEYKQKYQNMQDMLTNQAYMISRWVWTKNIDLKKFLNHTPNKDKKTMSDDEMLNQVYTLNAMLGGTIIEK